MKPWKIIMIGIAGWNAIGFLVGAANTEHERNSWHWEDGPNNVKIVVEDKLSGCVYKSFSAFTNPGYVVACELFRKRFSYEGIDKVIK